MLEPKKKTHLRQRFSVCVPSLFPVRGLLHFETHQESFLGDWKENTAVMRKEVITSLNEITLNCLMTVASGFMCTNSKLVDYAALRTFDCHPAFPRGHFIVYLLERKAVKTQAINFYAACHDDDITLL